METKQEFLDGLLKINPNYDIELLGKAYDKAEEMHSDQLRKSGEPFLIHPVSVAKILAELGMDEDTVVSGLLHDVVEDTSYTSEMVAKDFGSEVQLLVDGVTKLKTLVFESKEERQAENLRKMFLAMSKDIRVLIIKLADRLHNLRTINYMTDRKIYDKCIETLEIYAPLASRLGIFTMKFELEDIAFKHLEPEAYANLESEMKLKREQREGGINSVINDLKESLDDMKIPFEVTGRSKHFYSIYRKMIFQDKQLDEIFDLAAVRIIVETIRDCYAVLGIVHTMWRPIPGKFKDYIAMPKPNMYQSIHTTVISDNGEPFEIQIRTRDMHNIAEFGIAAHWKYKEGKDADKEEVKLAWLRQTLEWQKDMNDPREFMETLKVDLFASQVFVFTPKGDVIELPAGSTPLDFAFKIHSAVGTKCVGAKVNGKMVTIDYKLQNGNIVEIVTSPNASGPSIDWLKIAKSSNARSKIRAFLKKENKTDNVDKGKEVLEKYIKRKGYGTHDLQHILKNAYIAKATKSLKYASTDELYNQLSHGGSLLGKVATLLAEYYQDEKQEELKKTENDVSNIVTEKKKPSKSREKHTGVTVKGVDNLLIRFSKCCNPVPGDEIVGFITKGRGVSVHRKDCTNILSMSDLEMSRFIEVEWDADKLVGSYDSDIVIFAEDRKGLFSDLSRVCEDMDVHISGVNAKTSKDHFVNITMTLSISNTNQMQKVLRTLKSVQSVIDVHRAIT